MLVASGAAFGCTKIADGVDSLGASVVESTDEVRRVCPSRRAPDGGWVVVNGIDVSDYEITKWDEVVRGAPQFKYGVARVSAGLVRVDQRFSADFAGIKAAGLTRGAYQYFKPSQSAVAQANLYLSRLADEGGLQPDDLPPIFDLETNNDMPIPTVVCRAKIWLAMVENATHRLPIIYTSWNHDDVLQPEMKRYPLWVANYVGTPSQTCARMPRVWDKWDIWQYSESGGVPGVYANGDRSDGGGIIDTDDAGRPIKGSADLNYFDGTQADFDAFVRSSTSDGGLPIPAPPANPPHVHLPDGGGAIDCDDGCCIGD